MTLEELAQEYPLESFQLDFDADTRGWTLTALCRLGTEDGHECIDRFYFHTDTIEDAVALLSLKLAEVFDATDSTSAPVLSDNDN